VVPDVSEAAATRPVLIVDDNADVRDSLQFVLRLAGYDVRTASNGVEGLVEMRRQPAPCAVLLDLHMPVMNGFEFREQQSKDAELAAIPVIIFSGHHDVAEAADRLGIEAYFQKPFEVDEILELIRRYSTRTTTS
jgi:CheY-like chemotaxis protein